MALKDTKILIPEIPGEWTERIRNGHTNVWNQAWPPGQPHRNGLPEVSLKPPTRGLYAERIDNAWYWVCDCEKCLGNPDKHSYITCHDHDRCEICGIHREELTETPWGVRGGWACKPCVDAEDAKRKAEALAAAAEARHDESDCMYRDEIICPYCATEQSSDDIYESRDALECDTCGGTFSLEVEYSPSYTTKALTTPATA